MDDACFACARIAAIQTRSDPGFLIELSESYAVLSDHQGYAGWCILLLKTHEEHLDRLPAERQMRLAGDLARLASAVRTVFDPKRLNYECLGNVQPHVHWHVIPRHEDDPQPDAAVWVRPAAEREAGISDAERDERVRKLRSALGV